jgi:predicted DNA-binding protein (MmcQ/YjbR family)
MNAEEIRNYVLAKESAEESFPFGKDTLVFKISGKVFLLIGLDNDPLSFNAKCDPERAVELREEFPECILPGYHMNKKHWNTIIPEKLKSNLVKEMIDSSYDLVKPKKKK